MSPTQAESSEESYAVAYEIVVDDFNYWHAEFRKEELDALWSYELLREDVESAKISCLGFGRRTIMAHHLRSISSARIIKLWEENGSSDLNKVAWLGLDPWVEKSGKSSCKYMEDPEADYDEVAEKKKKQGHIETAE